MTKHLPPVPPASRSPKGPGGTATANPNERTTGSLKAQRRERNLAQEGRQANTRQNTTHQGYQQDR